jgi:Uma2 family endonuclease
MNTSMKQSHLTEDERLYEVVCGQRVELEPMGAFEVALATALWEFLAPFARRSKLGLVVSEMLFLLDAAQELKRRPDLAFVSYGRWPQPTIARTDAWDVVPDLAVEIISRSNSAEEVDGKIVEYFRAGVRQVWVLYPDSGRVYVYRSASDVHIVERTGELDGDDLLPGFRLPIQSLFDALVRPE